MGSQFIETETVLNGRWEITTLELLTTLLCSTYSNIRFYVLNHFFRIWKNSSHFWNTIKIQESAKKYKEDRGKIWSQNPQVKTQLLKKRCQCPLVFQLHNYGMIQVSNKSMDCPISFSSMKLQSEFLFWLQSKIQKNSSIHITLSLGLFRSLFFQVLKTYIISNKLFFFSYFLDNAKRICNSDYVPTMKDILHSRLKTVGVIELQIKMKGADFRVIDVGGQRTQRTKW